MVNIIKSITVKAPVNIAVIKYWGKKDEHLMIPLNDSISGTLSMDELCSQTTIALSEDFDEDRMWLNGIEEKLVFSTRLAKCIRIVKDLVGDKWPKGQHIRICSENNFPTAAGLASSAAGFACFAYALCNLFDITNVETISTIARSGSGSACRSVYGGFVHWIAGNDNKTSIAKQVINEHHWPEIRVLILVVNDSRKDTSSTSGMKLTCETSTLIKQRANVVVPERTIKMNEALHSKDFASFAELTMKDSNSFHSVCQDTYPPIRYMNDISWRVVNLIHFYNDKVCGEPMAAYTFDAGPNACIYLRQECLPELLSFIEAVFPKTEGRLEVKGVPISSIQLSPKLLDYVDTFREPNVLKYIISTKIGTGPNILSYQVSDDVSLLSIDGQPKKLK